MPTPRQPRPERAPTKKADFTPEAWAKRLRHHADYKRRLRREQAEAKAKTRSCFGDAMLLREELESDRRVREESRASARPVFYHPFRETPHVAFGR